jgi:hypothetical protein
MSGALVGKSVRFEIGEIVVGNGGRRPRPVSWMALMGWAAGWVDAVWMGLGMRHACTVRDDYEGALRGWRLWNSVVDGSD